MRKSWNFSLMQSEALATLMDRLLEPLGAAAFALPDGRALHIRPASPADLATLPLAANLCQQYLRLSDGEIAILNDPFSGGTHLADITLVCGLKIDAKGAGTNADLLIARRISMPARVSARNHLDDEGVRIPPTPLYSHGVLNKDLLEAIATHPLSAPGFFSRVEAAITELSETARIVRAVAQDPASELKAQNFKRFLADSSHAFRVLMGRIPLGARIVTRQLAGGETIKLALEVTENRILFNFAGTEASSALGLTEHATSGACLAAIAAVMCPDRLKRGSVPLNASAFEHIQVSTPAKTLLSSRAPSGMFRGMHQGIAIVASLVMDALAALNPALRTAASAGHHGLLQIAFDDGRFFSTPIAPGSGANREACGDTAIADFDQLIKNNIYLEASEKELPLLWIHHGVRANSGGRGKKAGGDGSTIAFQALAPARARWVMGEQAQNLAGSESGLAGLPAQIIVVRADGHREEFAQAEGEIALLSGDQVHFLGSGGGGFGEPPQATGA
jgi:N-methylhydantoinase B